MKEATSSQELLENLQNSIATLSTSQFSQKITKAVSCEYNTYSTSTQIGRMVSILELLRMGINPSDIEMVVYEGIEGLYLNILRGWG